VVKGKGGVFKVTARLADRVRLAARRSTRRWRRPPSWAAPSAWPSRGLKPVAEIQFFDYIWPAMMQIRDEVATHALAFQRHVRLPGWCFASPSAVI
jgi:2-oxoisovalerate dehydrogenase E1 component